MKKMEKKELTSLNGGYIEDIVYDPKIGCYWIYRSSGPGPYKVCPNK